MYVHRLSAINTNKIKCVYSHKISINSNPWQVRDIQTDQRSIKDENSEN